MRAGGQRAALLRDGALVTAVAALLLVPGLGAVDLFDPDEPREAQIATEMRAAGSWVVPTFDACPFLQKPPFYYWVASGLLGLGGIAREAAVRAPSAAATWGLALVTYLLGRELSHRRTGRAAALLLLTMHLPSWLGRRALLDPLLALFVGACVLCATLATRRSRGSGLLLVLAGVAGAGAVMTKGPIGLVMPALALAADAAMRRDVRAYLRPAAIVATLLPLLAFGGWIARLGDEPDGPCLVNEVLFENNARRFAGGSARGHQQPPWYYASQLPVALLPWSLFLPSALRSQWRGGRPGASDPAARLALAWLLPNLALLSVAATKRAIYLLPLAPAVALLVAAWWRDRAGPGRRGAWLRLPALALLATGILAAVAMPAVAALLRSEEALSGVHALRRFGAAEAGAAAPAASAGLLLIAAAVVASRRRPRAAPVMTLAAAAAATLAVGAWLLPLASRHVSARRFGEAILELRVRGEPVLVVDVNEGHLGQFLFYSGGVPLPWVASPERVLPADCVACRQRRTAADAVASAPGAVLMLEKHAAKLPPGSRGETILEGSVGSDRYVLFRPGTTGRAAGAGDASGR